MPSGSAQAPVPAPVDAPAPAPAPAHSQVTPWRARLSFTGALDQLLEALADEPYLCCLTGAWAGGGALVACTPLRVASAGDSPELDPFALLDELPLVARAGTDDAGTDAAGIVGGGWFGWLGYRLARRVEDVPLVAVRPVPMPEFHLAYYDNVLRRDARGEWWFEALLTPARDQALRSRYEYVGGLLQGSALRTPPTSPTPQTSLTPQASPTPQAPPAPAQPTPLRLRREAAGHHLNAVADCRERIAAGEIFEANVCLRFEGEYQGSALALLRGALRRDRERDRRTDGDGDCGTDHDRDRRSATPGTGLPQFTAAFDTPVGGILSLSPELFLRRAGREVVSGPIKGTAARPPDAAAAAASRARLETSAKDAAEHVMIVDLMRNDLGRVCEYGSVRAPRTPTAEAHPGVWHLVTHVRGILRAGVGDAGLLEATFPPGSVTGAPKVQALRVIAALEPSGREVFTGAVGFVSPLAGLELNVAIRTLELSAGRVWLGVGGAIVADSDPVQELQETLVKARPVAAALGTTVTVDPLPIAPARSALDYGPRPDPAAGVFETLRVVDGEIRALDAHLRRLAASARELYGVELDAGLEARMRAAARGHSGRLRVTLTPDGRVQLGRAPLGTPPEYASIAPFTLPGGLGVHKWCDRRLIDAVSAAAGPGALPLLIDADGAVLEAGWANVLIQERGALISPPHDGRLRSGVGCRRHRFTEEAVDLARLRRADAVLLTSALRDLWL